MTNYHGTACETHRCGDDDTLPDDSHDTEEADNRDPKPDSNQEHTPIEMGSSWERGILVVSNVQP